MESSFPPALEFKGSENEICFKEPMFGEKDYFTTLLNPLDSNLSAPLSHC
jgi:hypothetical protein